MKLTEDDVKEFQELYARKFGIRIDTAAAHVKATDLIRLMQIVYRPLTDAEKQFVPKQTNPHSTLIKPNIKNYEPRVY